MKNKEDLKDELGKLSPFLLSQKEKEDGFKVPKDYFKSLPEDVLRKVRGNEVPAVDRNERWEVLLHYLRSFFQPRYALAFSAVALLVVAAIYLYNSNGTSQAGPALLAEIPEEVLENYVSEHIADFDSDLFTSELAGSNLEALPDLEVKEMENYLLEELDDVDLVDLEDML